MNSIYEQLKKSEKGFGLEGSTVQLPVGGAVARFFSCCLLPPVLQGFQAGHHLALPAEKVWKVEERFLPDVQSQFSS